MGREGDATVGINARSLVAHNNNVDAVLSIHFNSGGGGTARGVETFYAKTRSGDKSFATSIRNAVVN